MYAYWTPIFMYDDIVSIDILTFSVLTMLSEHHVYIHCLSIRIQG